MKQFFYKVYDASDNFLATWDDEVISEPTGSEEINTGGTEMTIELARNPDDYGEGTEIQFDNVVIVYVKDKEYTSPAVLIQGKITKYMPFYRDKSEGVVVTILTLGDTFKDYVHSEDQIIEQSQLLEDDVESFSTTKSIAQSFIPTENTINSVDIKLAVAEPTIVTIYIQTNGAGNEPSGTTISGSTVSKTITDTSLTVYKFTFDSPVDITIGQTYWIVVTA